MATQVKVRERGLKLLWPRLNAGPVCDDSAAEGNICVNVALYKWTLPLPFTFYVHIPFGSIWQRAIQSRKNI